VKEHLKEKLTEVSKKANLVIKEDEVIEEEPLIE
jgi:hypothetical protein